VNHPPPRVFLSCPTHCSNIGPLRTGTVLEERQDAVPDLGYGQSPELTREAKTSCLRIRVQEQDLLHLTGFGSFIYFCFFFLFFSFLLKREGNASLALLAFGLPVSCFSSTLSCRVHFLLGSVRLNVLRGGRREGHAHEGSRDGKEGGAVPWRTSRTPRPSHTFPRPSGSSRRSCRRLPDPRLSRCPAVSVSIRRVSTYV
jgi:hypothetical protein